MDLIIKNIFFNLYSLLCFFYRNIFTLYNFLKFKKIYKKKSPIVFFKVIKNYYLLKSIEKFVSLKITKKYQKNYILSKGDLILLLKEIFDEGLRKDILEKTGFKYSIDFFTIYKNFHIENYDKKQIEYANYYHIDKPNSKNMLKLIIPLNEINYKCGPLILKKEYSNNLSKRKLKKSMFVKFNSLVNKQIIYAFHGSCAYHKALVPYKNNFCHQIMIQLNPSESWKINSNIYKRQFKIEPKFPELNYILDKYIKL